MVNKLVYLMVLVGLGFSTLYAEGLLYKNRDTVLKMLVNEYIELNDVDDIYKKDKELVLKVVDAYNYDYIDVSLKSDKEILRKAIENGYDLRKADENMSSDRALVFSSVKSNMDNFEYVRDEFKKDKDFVFEVVKSYYHNLKYANESLKKDREFIVRILKITPDAFEYIDKSLKDDKILAIMVAKNGAYIKSADRDINMASMKTSGYGLDFADENITDNREFVAEVIKKNPFAYKFISPRLKKDSELLLLAFKSIKGCGTYEMLKYADEELKKDKELVKEILKLNAEQYMFIAPELKKDRELALFYLANNGYISNVDKSFLEDNKFVLSVIKKTGQGLAYATKEQRADKALIIEALKLKAWAFADADESLKKDRAFILNEVVKVNNYDFVEFVDKPLLKDRSFVYELLKRDCYVDKSPFYSDKELILKLIDDTNGSIDLSYIDENLFRDEAFMLTAIRKAGQGLKYATKEQQSDGKLVLEAIKYNSFNDWEYVDESLFKDREFLLASLKYGDERWSDVNETLKKDKFFMLEAIKSYASEFKFADESLKKNRAFILEAIEVNSGVFEHIDEKLKDNKEFALKIVAINPFAISHLSTRLKNDKDIALAVLNANQYAFGYLGDELKKDKEFITLAYKEDSEVASYMDESLKSDRAFIWKLMKLKSFNIIKYLNPEFQDDEKIVSYLVDYDYDAMEHASSRLKNSRKFCLKVMQKQPYSINHIEPFQHDPEFLEIALKAGYGLQFATKEQKKNKELVVKVIAMSSYALEYADEVLRDDKEVVSFAIESGSFGSELDDASERLKKDKELVLKAIKKDGGAFRYADSSLGNDRAFVLEAVKISADILTNVSDRLKKDKEIVLSAVAQDGDIFEYIDDSLKSDKLFILEALKIADSKTGKDSEEKVKSRLIKLMFFGRSEEVWDNIDKNITKDSTFITQAIKETGYGLEYATPKQQADRDLVLNAVKYYPKALEYADTKLQDDREVVLEAVKRDGIVLKYASKRLQEDKKVVIEAINESGFALAYASLKFQKDESLLIKALRNDNSVLGFEMEDKVFILKLLKNDIDVTDSFDSELKNDSKFITRCIEETGYGMDYATPEQKKDRAFILRAIKKNFTAIHGVDRSLKNDKKFLLEALNNKKVLSCCLTHYDSSYLFRYHEYYFGGKLYDDKAFVMEALMVQPNIFKYIREDFKRDREVLELMDEIKNPLWKKIFNPLNILLFGLMIYWIGGRKKA